MGTLALGAALTGMGAGRAAGSPPSLDDDPWRLKNFMERVARASDIADPLERCLRMPDPPGTHWNRQGVEAYCRYHAMPSMTPARFQALIAKGQGAAVDKEFAGYLHAQMTDPANPGRLDRAMYAAGFHDADPKTRAAIDAWKKQRPDSPFALAASGIQYVAAAWAARGTATAGHTTDAQWAGMHAMSDLARIDLDRVAGMTPAVPPVYTAMYTLGLLNSDHEYAETALQHGFALQPGNVSLLLVQAGMTREQWGGTRARQEQLRREAAALAASQPLAWVVVGTLSIYLDEGGACANSPGKPLAEIPEVASASAMACHASTGRMVGDDDAMILAVEALRFDSGQTAALEIVGAMGRQHYAPWTKAALKRAVAENPGSSAVADVTSTWLKEF
ncbi:MAG: DUF4034 domain-containing protein [Luteibacter sp.]